MTTEGRAVLATGAGADAVARAVAEMRSAGLRAAGYVGEEGEAAREMARELLGDDALVVPVTPEE